MWSIAAKKYRQTEKGKATHHARNQRHNEKCPKKRVARNTLNRAVRKGKLPHIDLCECNNCGESAHLYHHHKGYEPGSALDVIPLCRKCDRLVHCGASVPQAIIL